MRKIAYTLICVFCALFALSGCGGQTEKSKTLQGDALVGEYVKPLGRTELKDGLLYAYNTGTGFEVSFYGTRLNAEFVCSNTESEDTRPYYQVFTDGEISPEEGKVIGIDKSEKNVKLVSELEEGVHTVTVVKRTESSDGTTAIKSLSTDGYFKAERREREMFIQIVGGSGISGHGAIGQVGEERTTKNSSCIHSFGYLTAMAFDADFEFVSNSGWGLKWGYNDASGKDNIRKAYDNIGIDENNKTIEQAWDHAAFRPDVVVVNVGGNDYTSHINKLSGAEKTAAEKEFTAAVKEFLEHIHALHPNAVVIWTSTDQKSGNGAASLKAIDEIDPAHSWVIPVLIEGSRNGELGADDHAGYKTHVKDAQTVVDAVCAALDIKQVNPLPTV